MRIGLIRRKYDPGGGGAEKVAANFVGQFTARGHSVSVLSESFEADQTDNLNWIRVPKGIMPSFSRTFSFHRNVQKLLSKLQFDVTYSMCRTFPVDIFRVTEQLHAVWLPVNYSSFAALNPRHRSILKLERKVLSPENTRYVVTNSKLTARQVVERFAYPSDRITVIRNGVDREKFFPARDASEKAFLRETLGLDPEKYILLFVADNFRIKGLTQALKTLAGLDAELKRNTLLLVIGGDDPAPYRKTASGLGVSGNILFAGSRTNMRDYYAAADLLFYPSLYEPFANVCLEACACALPVLTTAMNGSSELVEDGGNGYLVSDAGKIEEMRKKVSEFAKLASNMRISFTKNALRAAEGYTWDNHVDKLEEFFYRVKDENQNRKV